MLLQTMRIVNPEECHRLEENLRREQVHGMPFEEVVTLIAARLSRILYLTSCSITPRCRRSPPLPTPFRRPDSHRRRQRKHRGLHRRRPRGSFHTSRPCRFWSLRGSQCKCWEGRRGRLQRRRANPRQNPGRQNRAAASSCRGTFRRNDQRQTSKQIGLTLPGTTDRPNEEKSLPVIHPR